MDNMTERGFHSRRWILVFLGIHVILTLTEISGVTGCSRCLINSTNLDSQCIHCYYDVCGLANKTTCQYDNVTYSCECNRSTDSPTCQHITEIVGGETTTLASTYTYFYPATTVFEQESTNRSSRLVIVYTVVPVLIVVLFVAGVAIAYRAGRSRRNNSAVPPPNKNEVGGIQPGQNEATPDESESGEYETLDVATDPQGTASYIQLLREQETEDSYSEIGDLPTGACGVNEYECIPGQQNDYCDMKTQNGVSDRSKQQGKQMTCQDAQDNVVYQNV